MLPVNTVKRFISGDFENAILSGRMVEDNLILRLHLSEETKDNFGVIPYYSDNFNKIINESYQLSNELLDEFLESNEVLGVTYRAKEPHHFDKYCIKINGTRNLTLAFEGLESEACEIG